MGSGRGTALRRRGSLRVRADVPGTGARSRLPASGRDPLSRGIALLLDRADRSDGVTCRASMCRTRLSLADEEHYRAFMSRFGDSAPPWLGEIMLRREPSDGAGVTLWLYYTASDRTDGAS